MSSWVCRSNNIKEKKKRKFSIQIRALGQPAFTAHPRTVRNKSAEPLQSLHLWCRTSVRLHQDSIGRNGECKRDSAVVDFLETCLCFRAYIIFTQSGVNAWMHISNKVKVKHDGKQSLDFLFYSSDKGLLLFTNIEPDFRQSHCLNIQSIVLLHQLIKLLYSVKGVTCRVLHRPKTRAPTRSFETWQTKALFLVICLLWKGFRTNKQLTTATDQHRTKPMSHRFSGNTHIHTL